MLLAVQYCTVYCSVALALDIIDMLSARTAEEMVVIPSRAFPQGEDHGTASKSGSPKLGSVFFGVGWGDAKSSPPLEGSREIGKFVFFIKTIVFFIQTKITFF